MNIFKRVVSVVAASLISLSASHAAEIYYVHNDHLGTPKVLTDKDQNVVWKAEHDAFGEAKIEVELVEMNIRFPGQYYDKETGMHYNYYRDYDPSLGRYLQSDPIGLAGGINTYGYVGGNPIMYTDPEGLSGGLGSIAAGCGASPLCRAMAAGCIVGAATTHLTASMNGNSASLGKLAGGCAAGAGAAATSVMGPLLNHGSQAVNVLKAAVASAAGIAAGMAGAVSDAHANGDGNTTGNPTDAEKAAACALNPNSSLCDNNEPENCD